MKKCVDTSHAPYNTHCWSLSHILFPPLGMDLLLGLIYGKSIEGTCYKTCFSNANVSHSILTPQQGEGKLPPHPRTLKPHACNAYNYTELVVLTRSLSPILSTSLSSALSLSLLAFSRAQPLLQSSLFEDLAKSYV